MPKAMVRDIARMHSQQVLQRVLMAEGGHRQTVKEEELKLWDADKLKAALLPEPMGTLPASPQHSVQEVPRRGRLRIGYLSADFCNHPTADLMQSALLLHDKSKFGAFPLCLSRGHVSACVPW